MKSSCLLMFLKPIFSFGIMIFKFFFYVQRTKNNKSKAILLLYAARTKKKKFTLTANIRIGGQV